AAGRLLELRDALLELVHPPLQDVEAAHPLREVVDAVAQLVRALQHPRSGRVLRRLPEDVLAEGRELGQGVPVLRHVAVAYANGRVRAARARAFRRLSPRRRAAGS